MDRGVQRQGAIAIYRPGSLGDTVVALPCFHLISQSFPDARRVVITNRPVSSKAPSLSSILSRSGLIDDVIEFPHQLRNLRDRVALVRRLRSLDASTLVYLGFSDGLVRAWRDYLFFRLAGFKIVIGVPIRRDLERRRLPATGEFEREAERLARCLSGLGQVDLHDQHWWNLRLQPDERQRATEAVSPLNGASFISVNMGGKLQNKDWGEANWSDLLRGVTEITPMAIAFVGSAEDTDRAERIRRRLSTCTINLCGALSPRETAAVLERSALFVGHDSGPLHLAAAMGTRTIGLFGESAPPAIWHPIGSQHCAIHDMRGVLNIQVSEVLQRVAWSIRQMAG